MASGHGGVKEYGYHANLGPFSGGIKTEDPVRSWMGRILPYRMDRLLPGGNWTQALLGDGSMVEQAQAELAGRENPGNEPGMGAFLKPVEEAQSALAGQGKQ